MVMLIGSNSNIDKINKGVSINWIDVGGMTKGEASSILNKKYNSKIVSKVIKMKYKDRTFNINYKELKAHYDIATAVNTAYGFEKDGNALSRALINLGLGAKGYNVKLVFLSDLKIVKSKITRISKKIGTKPVDATISYANGNFTIVPERKGLAVNTKKLQELIENSVTPDENDVTIDIPTVDVIAETTEAMLSKIDTEISSYTTSFSTADASRSGNIKIAAEAIDGSLVLPGEIFSMNKGVGPRIAAKGYQEAHVIVNGELTTGMAGGICQATTTVYNAALLANFQIVQRKGHGLKVGYVKAGRDATISGDYIDFRFKNTNKNPIFIHTIVNAGKVTVEIFGANEHPGQTVDIISTVLEKIPPPEPEYIKDPTLYIGTEKVESKAIQGLKSIAYRKVYQDGKLIKDELLSKDKYKAARAKILIGTKPLNS
jgi:vancomycin resistance protein YoaR